MNRNITKLESKKAKEIGVLVIFSPTGEIDSFAEFDWIYGAGNLTLT